MDRIAASTSLEDAALKPWHLKLAVKLFDAKGVPTEDGTIEEWWASPNHWRVSYHLPSYTATVDHRDDGMYRTKGVGSPPYLLEEVRRLTVRPMPDAKTIAGSVLDLRKQSFGKQDFDCVMLTQPIKNEAYPPLGLFPTYCLARDQDRLRLSFDFGSGFGSRNRLGVFQNRDVPMELTISEGEITQASGHIDELSVADVIDFEATPIEGLAARAVNSAQVSGSVLAGTILTRELARYPQSAKNRGISGTVVLRAIIGTDGRVHSLRPISTPDGDLTIASIAAVRHWTYKPYLLNGEPVEVDTTITVNFMLDRPR